MCVCMYVCMYNVCMYALVCVCVRVYVSCLCTQVLQPTSTTIYPTLISTPPTNPCISGRIVARGAREGDPVQRRGGGQAIVSHRIVHQNRLVH